MAPRADEAEHDESAGECACHAAASPKLESLRLSRHALASCSDAPAGSGSGSDSGSDAEPGID
jgi:hypothetical protein